MIKSTKGKLIEKLAQGKSAKGFPEDLRRRAERKLAMIDAAHVLEDLRVPPANRLEALGGNRAGAHSIRINQQWRICFIWKDGDAWSVEIVDYH